jgi:hypothetical protein
MSTRVVPAGAPVCKFQAPHFETPASDENRATAISLCITPAPRCLETVMNRDPRFALSQELEAKQTLLDQLRALATDDTDFFTDLLEGETNLLEFIAALDASIVDDETLADGAKTALDKLQTRKRAAENRIELKRRLLPHTLQQIGLKTLRTPTSTLTVAEASLKAIAVAPEDTPHTGGSHSCPNSIRTGSPKQSAHARKRSRRPRPSRTRRNAAGRWLRSRPSIQ